MNSTIAPFGNPDRKEFAVALTRKEAADLIALLAGQLARTTIQGNHAGAAPSVILFQDSQLHSKLHFVVNPD